MAGKEKDHLAQSINKYFKVQSVLKNEADKLDREKSSQKENDKVEPIQKVVPAPSE